MPALKPTEFEGQIVWLGVVTTMERDELLAASHDALDLTFEGLAGSVHGGLTRPSCSRVVSQYKKGTPIRNERQLSLISEEELDMIAKKIGVDRIDPARLGASVVVRGLPDFSHLPPSSRLQAASGATIAIDMQNRPCLFPARSIEHVASGHGKGFKQAAKGLRGLTGWVAAEGRIAVGDVLQLHIPDQRAWAPGS